jgi:hypothetical protein
LQRRHGAASEKNMKLLARRHSSWASLAAAAFALLTLSNPADAEEPRPGSVAPAPTPAPEPTPGTAPVTPQAQATAPPDIEPKANPAASQSLGPVERLPPDAYPAPRVRGIYGGSLWSTFHGLQWPYYPKTGIGVSGYVWVDTGYEHIAVGDPSQQSAKFQLQEGRALLRATPTWSDGNYFVQGQAELVANKNQITPSFSTNVDDMWVRVGKWNAWDVEVGRYEAWEVYHFGMGLDLNTLERAGASYNGNAGNPIASIYGVTYAFYRPAAVGEGALHIYPTDWLRFELGTQYGDESGQNTVAGRPVAVLDLGWLKVKAGGEWKKQTPVGETTKGQLTQYGFGGAVQVVVDPYVEAGINAAYGVSDANAQSDGTPDSKASGSTYSVGAFANGRIIDGLLVGAGLNYTYLTDKHFDGMEGRNEIYDQWQGFGAIQYYLFKQIFIKGVFGYAKADFNPTFGAVTYANTMLSGRVRLLYLF